MYEYLLGGSSHLVSGLVHPSYVCGHCPHKNPIYNQGWFTHLRFVGSSPPSMDQMIRESAPVLRNDGAVATIITDRKRSSRESDVDTEKPLLTTAGIQQLMAILM